MEERYINAVVIKSGEKVRVKQSEPGSEYFVTEDNSPYHSKELDFTQQDIVEILTKDLQEPKEDPFKESHEFFKKIMSSLDPLESEKRRAEAAAREYWRRLRGDIYLELIKAEASNDRDVNVESTQNTILRTTNIAVCTLYLMDQTMFSKTEPDNNTKAEE